MDATLAALSVCVAVYLVMLVRGYLGDRRVSLYGPVVMLKCQKCVDLIKRLACTRMRNVAFVAVASWVVAMVAGMAMLTMSTLASFRIPPEHAPSPATLIGLPGLNPLIPITYGAVGLVVAVAVHELAHGLALAANRLSIKSAGLVLLGLPLGAFVEPGDDFQSAEDIVKVKVYSSGPFANLVVAALALLLLTQLFAGAGPVVEGIGVTGIYPGSPAEKAGLKPGDVITWVDGKRVTDLDSFFSAMEGKKAGDAVTIALSDNRSLTITLADRFDFTKRSEDKGKGFIGIELIDVGGLKEALPLISGNPLEVAWKLLSIPLAFQRLLLLSHFYNQPPGGWDTTYVLLWISWMNAAIGLTNVLPVVPLDGGSALVSTMKLILQRSSAPRRELIVKTLVAVVSAVTAAMIVAPIIVPRLRLLIP
ncbi:MAG: site-2 protease family protein [Thermofilaceae archaeon]